MIECNIHSLLLNCQYRDVKKEIIALIKNLIEKINMGKHAAWFDIRKQGNCDDLCRIIDNRWTCILSGSRSSRKNIYHPDHIETYKKMENNLCVFPRININPKEMDPGYYYLQDYGPTLEGLTNRKMNNELDEKTISELKETAIKMHNNTVFVMERFNKLSLRVEEIVKNSTIEPKRNKSKKVKDIVFDSKNPREYLEYLKTLITEKGEIREKGSAIKI
jgi:hypothetical protein